MKILAKYSFSIITILFISNSNAQNYNSFITGSTIDVVSNPSAGVCLMGGATEEDEAMKWFLQRADGGDILVLRASGSDGYNDYFYNDLGISVNSVESIVFNDATASNEPYIHQRIQQAEGIWFAGGDQWNYISYWRNTPIDSLINIAIAQRNIVIGGTSAGMAILGGHYFSAQNGTVSSANTLSNPYNSNVTVDSSNFLNVNYLEQVITDTHYDNPDRKGRHVVFMARILNDYAVNPKGIACDEYTAVCVEPNGIAHVFGQFPEYDDNAYFIQVNCTLSDRHPEICTSGQALTWNRTNEALKVYKVKGTLDGSNTFDLNNWDSVNGGSWQNWYVENGVLNEVSGDSPDCILSINQQVDSQFTVYPNPAEDHFNIAKLSDGNYKLEIIDLFGRLEKSFSFISSDLLNFDIRGLNSGLYNLKFTSENGKISYLKLIVK